MQVEEEGRHGIAEAVATSSLALCCLHLTALGRCAAGFSLETLGPARNHRDMDWTKMQLWECVDGNAPRLESDMGHTD